MAAVLCLTIVGNAGAQTPSYQAGPFPAGNLLSYANSDFEQAANFIPVSNATITDSGTSFLHNQSLQDTVGSAGTSSFTLQEGATPTSIDVTAGATYTISGYFKLSSPAVGQTVAFGLSCYDSNGNSVGSAATQNLALAGQTGWQYVEGQTTLPSGCTSVVDSPQVTLSGMAAGETANLDEMTFRPYRAALVMGAHGNVCYDGNCSNYSAQDWLDTNNVVGGLQSDKQFFTASQSLPASWASSSNHCYLEEQALPTAQWPVCIIAYKVNETEAQLESFLAGMPTDQEVLMTFWQEPERQSFSGCTKRGNGANFVCYFERQSNYIRAAAAADGVMPEVFVNMDSADYAYDPLSEAGETGESLEADNSGAWQNGTSCSFIPPAKYVDVYTDDHYEVNGVDNMAAGPAERSDNWADWLKCVQPQDKPLGLAEYGNTYASGQGPQITADASYLASLPSSVHEEILTWTLWDNGGDSIDNNNAALAAWQAAENQN